jgi:hypothetical protein
MHRALVRTVPVTFGLILSAFSALGNSGEVTLAPVQDNTLYSDTVAEGEGLSNGAGGSLFVGATFGNDTRRALIAFDLSGVTVPEDAVITEVTLSLDITRDPPGAGSTSIALHRLTAAWGEGASDAGEPGGNGAPAESGDATWQHRFFDTDLWTAAGGDFVSEASASQSADGLGPVVWAGNGLIADVSHWLANPAENFGWILIGDEATAGSARRFASREHATAEIRPRLLIRWAVPQEEHSADTNSDNAISLGELLRVIQFFNSAGFHCEVGTEDGFAPGPGDEICAAHASDYNPPDWAINLSELLRLIQFFNSAGYTPCPEGEDGFCIA